MASSGRLPFGIRFYGTTPVRLYRGDPDDAATPATGVSAHVELSSLQLPSGTDVCVGDVVEYRPRRREPVVRKVVTAINEGDGFIAATWTTFRDADVELALRLQILRSLHPDLAVSPAAGLFADGHYAQAVFEAMKLLESRVKQQSGLDVSGRDLMAKAFDGDPPPVDLRQLPGRSGDDEQNGLRFVFMGAMQGLRNPHGHEPGQTMDPQEAIETLSLVSLLFRRLDWAATVEVG